MEVHWHVRLIHLWVKVSRELFESRSCRPERQADWWCHAGFCNHVSSHTSTHQICRFFFFFSFFNVKPIAVLQGWWKYSHGRIAVQIWLPFKALPLVVSEVLSFSIGLSHLLCVRQCTAKSACLSMLSSCLSFCFFVFVLNLNCPTTASWRLNISQFSPNFP